MKSGWDQGSNKKNLIRKDFAVLRRQIRDIERSRPDRQGKLTFLGIILIKIGFALMRMEVKQNIKLIK
jgi:hypothetical protein